MTLESLTERQRAIFDFIVAEIGKGVPPTVREIGRHFGITSPNGVMAHIHALVKKGLIKRGDNQARSITLVHRELMNQREQHVITAAVRFCEAGTEQDRTALFSAVKEYQS